MTSKTLVLSIFEDETAAENAATTLRASGTADRDAIGVLALDENGGLKLDKVGARSIGTVAGVGAALALLAPIGVGAVISGAAVGALHHKGLQLTGSDRARIAAERTNGKAAVGVLARGIDVRPISAALADLGGTLEAYDVSDEDALQAADGVDQGPS